MSLLTDKKLRTAIRIYDGVWRVAGPLLRINKRLKDGLFQRRLETPLPSADLWIQAASGGEAYLAITLIEQLSPDRLIRILVTTNTKQGMEILEKGVSGLENSSISVSTNYFPFDQPKLMEDAVDQVKARLVVLLETEIWPGLLYACKRSNLPVIVINGRMTEKSLSRYRKFAGALYRIGPEQVLAISHDDASRFASLFGNKKVSVMPNIKFDRLATQKHDTMNPFALPVSEDTLFLVLGSIRQEEEVPVANMIAQVLKSCPETVIGLFPRHMHRVSPWEDLLNEMGMDVCLRSTMKTAPRAGQIIIWDVFGELAGAYASASAVFVGGSLVPLGGQNFLEPLISGIIPVIGPYHENFAWVGDQLFSRGLVEKAGDAGQAAVRLIEHLKTKPDRSRIQAEARDYIRSHQGGAQQACQAIRKWLA